LPACALLAPYSPLFRSMAPAFLAKLHAVLLALLAVSALAACSERRDGERGPVVLAASSLQEALEEIGEAWAEQGHAQPVFSFAASSALARQVGQGDRKSV